MEIPELTYPFNAEYLLKKKKKLKRAMLSDENVVFIDKRIAILGGVTTDDIRQILELFLLNYGIRPTFYESEYNQYYEEGMFPGSGLADFAPDIIYICTSIRNINEFPEMTDSRPEVCRKRDVVVNKFAGLWEHIFKEYRCPVIQNNFEYPYFRLLGNRDASDIHGRVNFITELNREMYQYAQAHENFYICDINYLSASYGLDRWSDPYYWYMYKYAVAVPAIPYLSFNVANMIKSIYGKNKKAYNLDLDNTLWGGLVGEDGADNIEIGQESPTAQIYSEFQEYLKLHKQLGVLLTINSKNDEEIAASGLERPDGILKKEDFVSVKCNWNPKHENLEETARELELLPESFVFVDDNPAEWEIVAKQLPGVAAPALDVPEHYIYVLDRSGFFETTSLSQDDLERTKMYQENRERRQAQASLSNYKEYLESLEMRAEIQGFIPVYMGRIAQLTNKSNQFNLTTRRYSQSEIEAVASDKDKITLYGKLTDKFGDNGVVSVVIGEIRGDRRDELHVELWLMSCRVLKRNMEYAMMDSLVKKCMDAGIKKIYGYYYPTKKNGMVKDFYAQQGFAEVSEDSKGNTVWEFEISNNYREKQDVIKTK